VIAALVILARAGAELLRLREVRREKAAAVAGAAGAEAEAPARRPQPPGRSGAHRR
jgi:hypothetical protein